MRQRQQGFSLIELTVVLGVVSVLMLIVYSMIEDTVRATMFNESHNDLTIMTQRAANALQEEVLQARVAFEEDAAGSAYRAALQIPVSIPRWTTTLLPVMQSATTTIVPDGAGERFAGNSLLIARQLAPLTVTYDHDGNAGTPELEFLADRYRFEYFFLSPVTSRSFARSGFTLDLLRSDSIDYVDFFQLSSMSAANLQRVVPRIRSAGIERAWNPGQPIAAAFYELSGAVDGTFDAPLNAPQIAIRRTASLFPELRGGRISGKMDYSLAFTPMPIRRAVAMYAQPDASRPNFPAGFEVKIAGPAGNRQVVTRVLLMAHYGVSTYEAQQGVVTTAARF